ncbi:MAG: phospholipid carrier-dependent glycosyltransferase [Anaerolineaceae bacterium]|nr:phospholipid carrier-dependent glycosyltransferase [Anaerolineaceae bacterium]
MLILFGVMGLLQSVLLPGLLLMKAGKLRGGIIERLLWLFPLSLTANYLLIFLLASLHLYTRPVVLGLIALECLCLFLLYRGDLTQPLKKTLSGLETALKRELSPLDDFLTEKTDDPVKILKDWVWAVSGCAALSGVFWAFHLCRLNFGTLFSGWDTLFSWNHYAVIWAGGSVPDIGGMYPQMLPANWSLSYLLQGKDAVQFFNTLLPPLFFLMIQSMLFDLGFQRKSSGFFFAAVIARFMMKKLMGDQLFDGYMDVPAAAMCLLTVYCFLKADGKEEGIRRQAILLGTVFAAGAAVTKQSGSVALLSVPLFVGTLHRDVWEKLERKQKIWLFAGAALIVIPWYAHCFLFNTHGAERELIAEGIMDYNRVYDIPYRLQQAASALGKYGLCFLAALAGLPFIPKRYRLPLSFMVWPLTLVWAFFYSYDARNLGPVLPFVSLLSGMALSGAGEFALKVCTGKNERARMDMGRVPLAAAVLLFIAAVTAVLVRVYPDAKLTEGQREKQKALFGERLNRELLYGYFGEEHTGNDIYTDYPAQFLSGYGQCCSAAKLTDTEQVRGVLEGSGINWLLLPVVMPNNTDPSKELIEQCIEDGKCEKISCSDGYYKAYCLYQIHR